jgi:exodeoxyribonuclease VII small subunit
MEKINFEEAMNELELSVKRLEGGNMSLDDSLLEFEKAIKLVKVCNERLELAEQRVRMLTASLDGGVTDVPFSIENEN